MNQLQREYIYHMFIIKECLRRLVGEHYPIELVSLIVSLIVSVHKQINISCGSNHTILMKNGKIYGWGDNFYGQLGGHNDQKYKPREFIYNAPIKSIICGGCHIYCVTNTKIYVRGNNSYGQLGLKSKNICREMCEFNSIREEKIKSIICGTYHTIALIEDESTPYIYVWGCNLFGQLGLGHCENQALPQKLYLNKSIVAVSCGEFHTMCLTKDARLIYVWGFNQSGQLGLGHCINQNSPQEIKFASDIISVSCGRNYTMALTLQGDIWAWGSNHVGQLGLGHTYNVFIPKKLSLNLLSETKQNLNPISITCGGDHTIAMADNGKIYVWGLNNRGQLGLGDEDNKTLPQEFSTVTNIIMINCGEYHTIALTRDNRIYVWGKNTLGQLGLGDFTNRFSPYQLNL